MRIFVKGNNKTNFMEAKELNKERYREMAISYWENKKKGIHNLADKKGVYKRVL